MNRASVLAEELDEIEAGRRGELPIRSRLQEDRQGSSEEIAPISFCDDVDRKRAAEGQLCGLAFSGGGIRSATFNLGVIQVLADLGLLSQVDYLSTVSGGGYIGAWLTAWVHRTAGIAEVQSKLRKSVQRAEASDGPEACVPNGSFTRGAGREQPPITFLREHSNYLTPRIGLFSADTWSAISIYLRNLVLNLTILIGVLLAVLLLPRLALSAFELSQRAMTYGLALACLSVTVVMSGLNLRFVRKSESEDARPSRRRRETPARTGWKAWFPQQSAVLSLIVLPATTGAFFVAASMRRTDGLTRVEFCLLAAAYLALWLLLVLVWKPFKVSTRRVRDKRGSRDGASRGENGLRGREDFEDGPGAVPQAIVYAAAAALLAVALVGRFTASGMTATAAIWMTAGVPVVVTIFSLSVVLHLGLMGRLVSEEVREWWSRLGGWLLIVTLAWITLCGVSLMGPVLLDWAGAKLQVSGAGVWLATTAFGVWSGRSASTNGKDSKRLVQAIASVAPYVFVLGLLLALSAFADWALLEALHYRDGLQGGNRWTELSEYWAQIDAVPWTVTFFTSLGCLVGALFLSWRVDVNDFSLQPFYRNRLVRCYLGASNEARPAEVHPFTGFDPRDDICLAHLPRKDRALRPYPLINVALNLVKGENLAWQERKARSFTLAPLHCGFGDYYRRTGQYADGRLTLGQAFATSGAAASPNMGYHSSPALAFLMTVFNVRLGTWLANPKSKRWQAPGPRLGLVALLDELFGNTNEDSRFVYLSDGGHFENLGIYELVRRRCRFIIACDASADPKVRFDDLGGVLRKCRTDFGVDVDLDTVSLQRDPQTGRCSYHCAVGTVRYPEGTSGTLLYLKASLTGREPVDVLNYAAADALFPHQSTADQWFSESQFESYRRLGYHCGHTVFEAAAKDEKSRASLEGIFTSLRERWYPSTGIAAGAFTGHAATLDKLTERIRANPRLSFLDAQIYPSWPELMEGTNNPPTADLWLPRDPEARREGFYLCTSLIQLMANVYTDLALATQFDHPDNRGWMNLFRHWTWCGMVRVTWAITAPTYGARFQTFCRERLDLDIGRVEVRPGDAKKLKEMLNPIEQKLVAQFEDRQGLSHAHKLYAINLRVPNPMASELKAEEAIDFKVGFAIVQNKRLAYLRIQDHLRKTGLAREALQYMMGNNQIDDRVESGLDPVDLRSEYEKSAGQATVRHLFESAAAEQSAGKGGTVGLPT